GRSYACTGVFVETDLILTAAHCRIKNGGRVDITLYKNNDPGAAQVIEVTGADFQYAANPRYRKASAYDPGSDDIGLLVLKSQSLPDGFEVAPLQTSAIVSASDPGRPVFVAGTGVTHTGAFADRILFAQGTITTYLDGSVLQINFPYGVGVCGGDSGGPVFVRSNGHLYLSALVTSTPTDLGSECGNSLYANGITADRYNWVQKTADRIRSSFLGL
ncbi:MAG: trypsin-like serine protease, partial [Bdellovibrionota bacterium]